VIFALLFCPAGVCYIAAINTVRCGPQRRLNKNKKCCGELCFERGIAMTQRFFLIGIVFLLNGNSWAQSPLDDLTESDLVEGEKLFRVHCASCHGIAGQGGEGSNLAKPRLKYAPDDEALIELLSEGIPGTGMPAIWTLDEARATRVAGYVRSLGDIAAEEMPGDPVRGEEIYRTAGGCPACHIISGHGIGIGPELTGVGDRRGLAYLQESLVDPAKAQSQTAGYKDYLTVRATAPGGAVEGMRINEDAFSIQIRDAGGVIHSFRKSELKNLEKIFAHSLMPEYTAVLSETDLDNVISYLMSLRSTR
jgi:putative heme-binding domain-containing protein